MDKNKSRNDLLAAGRKKLQQFRQKKDGQGSSSLGKSSRSASKHEQAESDVDTLSAAAKPTEARQVAERGIASEVDSGRGIVDSSMSPSMENSLVSEVDAAVVELSSEPSASEVVDLEMVLVHEVESKPQRLAVSDHNAGSSAPIGGDSSWDIDAEVVRATPSTSEFPDSAHKSVVVDVLGPPALADAMEGVGVKVEKDDVDREGVQDLLPSQKDIPDSSLIEARGDQVTDVGAMQETNGLSSKQSAATLEVTGEAAVNEAKQTGNAGDISASPCPTYSPDGSSTLLALAAPDGMNPELIHQQRDDIVADRSEISTGSGDCGNDQQKKVSAGSGNGTVADVHGELYLPDATVVSEGLSCEEPLKTDDLSSSVEVAESRVQDGCSMSLSQLVEVIRGLGEDEYKFLLKSRGLASNVEFGTGGLVERMKEELYLTNCAKDIFHLQLAEQSDLQREFDHQHHQLLSEISKLHASLDAAHERNGCLAEDLVDCRSKLEAVTASKKEVQDQLHAAKAQVEEFSARADDLQLNLERSQADISSLSMEFSESKGQLATLQVENEKLSGMIASVTDERNKLLEEKESTFLENDKWLSEFADCRNLVGILHEENDKLNGILASLADEKKKLVEENQCCLLENEKLSLELADCQSLLAVQVVDNSNLSEIVILETEDRKKLEEEKESLAHENEKVCVELDDLKSLVSAMQAENANLIGGLSLVTDERKKLEEEKKSFVCENQRLSSELLLLQEQLSTEHGGIHKAKMREIDNRETYMETECLMPVNQVESSRVKVASHGNATDDDGSCLIPAKPNVEILSTMTKRWFANDVATGLPIERLEEEVFDDSFGFVFLKEHLEEAEKIMLHLEKAIERIQSHSSNLSRSSSKLGAPAVLKLIQAFESKGHHDEHEVDERAVTEDQSATDPFISVKEQAGNLRAVLKQLGLDAKTSSVLFKGVHDHGRTASDTLRELDVQYKALKEHNDNLEAANIELQIICEAVKQQLCRVEAKNTELEHHLEELKQREIGLRAENIKLSEKLSVYQSRVSEMHSQLDGLRRRLQEMDSTMHDQLNRLEKEESERLAMFEQEWTSYIAQIVEIVGRLDKNSMRSLTYSFSTVTHDGLDISNCIAVSVDAAVEMIEDLQGKLEAACADHEAVSNSYKELNEKFSDLLERNELAMDILYKVYSDLRKLVTDMCGSQNKLDIDIQNPQLPDPLDYRKYNIIIELLGNFLGEMLHLQSVNEKLNSELANRTEDIAELNKKYLDSSAIQKLIEEIGTVVKLEAAQTSLDESPYPYLEALVSLLVQKYIEVGDQLSLSREELGAKELALTEIQEKILQRENEFLVISGSLGQAEEALRVVRAELQEKANELEQSEQRVSSIREKLSIAVAKGKGLVVQRDSLKQSLAETSNELDKCSQELKLKDARLQDVETKLKTYSEAGERVEALESELSYIRNSATALRESFLLKDSVLQRIEEILEDLDLPEHFHSRDIIEKVDWLARSATGNSLPQTDWDQKSSVGGSYSDAGIVVMDAWKEDTQQSANTVDDLRRKYEELQGKFYGLAEQNEMLEQSLMERNHLVQRWEELMDRISMPSQLRSVEPEDKIEWLGSALSEAMHDRDSLQQKIDNLENYCRSLTADLEVSEKKISDIEADLQSVVLDREHLSERLENMTFDHEKLSARTVQLELENGKLQNEVNALQEKLVEKLANEECVQIIEGEIRRLQDLVRGALLDAGMMDLVYTGSSIECLEGLLRKIIENYNLIALAKPLPEDAVGGDCTEARGVNPNLSGSRESLVIEEPAVDGNHTESADTNLDEEATSRVTLVTEEPYVASLKKDLEEALHQLRLVKEERDSYMEKQQSLLSEVEALDRKREELLQLLNQEEQKSASIREKLNVAVRKGKSLVQQRDTLKQTIEQMNNEMDRMKSKINNRENALAEYEQKIRELTSYCEKIEVLESECLSLRNHLTEKENLLQERGHTLTMMLNTLSDIDVGDGGNASNPVEKLQQIGKLFRDLHEAVASSEQDSRKSRRAAELLVAELNEVQERNDGLQEELARSATELAELSKQRDAAEAAKLEALSHLEKLSIEHYEEKRKQYSDFMAFKISLNQIKDHFSDISNLLSAVFSKDLEFLHGLEANMETCLKEGDAVALVGMSLFSAPAGITSSNSVNKENVVAMDSWSDNNLLDKSSHHDMIQIRGSVRQNLHELMTGIGKLKEIVHNHSVSLYEQLNSLSKVMETFHREMTSQKESFEVMRRDMMYRESIRKEKDTEIVGLLNNIALLCEACANSVSEIENKKAELVGNNMVPRELGMDLNQARIVDTEIPFGREDQLSSKEFIKSVAERLYLTVKEFGSMNAGIIEANQKEMKITIANLQKELQEKDIQKDRICMELVHQIKEAEATARSYSMDLQSSNVHMHDLEKQLEEKEGDRHLLELRVKELQDGLANMTELQERVSFLSDILVAKEQEIEALMQALDEEEVQMEDLNNKIRELEKVVQEKNLYLENLEVSRGKVVKKLSVTVSKFDELHHMSESLLAEVEKLQSQLQDRDAEISFLRQEVTRCTNEVLMASQMSNKRDSDEIHEFLMWFDTVASQVGYQDLHLDNKESSQAYEYKEVLRKRITSMISELENLKVVAQNKGALLEVERSKVEELKRREETLEKFLHEKESRLNVLEGVGKLDQTTGMTSEILEVEPVINKRSVPVPSIPSRIRSLRKANNDQVAIAIEADPDDNSTSLEEDDDKAHGFKSLTTSRIVPRFTRPVTDLIDGLWVSCDRTLMRQPALRLGIILYWAVMHALLGAFVV